MFGLFLGLEFQNPYADTRPYHLSSSQSQIMSLKRPHAEDDVSASEDEESLEPISSANNPVPSHYVQAKIDPTYGQRSAFPGLDGDPGDDNSFYGPASDGLEYLRMVR